MLIAVFSISLSWVVLFAAFLGLGLGLLKLHVASGAFDMEQVINGFWLGWCVVLLVLQIWHLFFPVNLLLPCLVLLFGAASLWFARNELRRSILQVTLRSPWPVLLGVGCVLVLANLATAPIRAYDAGLYHVSSIRWASTYAIVPGLANLHDRLGFNSSYFLYQAMLEGGLWAQRSHHIASGLLLLVVIFEIGVSTHKILTGGVVQFSDLMRVVLLATVADQCFAQASTTSPDLPMHLIGIVMSVRLCRFIFSEAPNSEMSDLAAILLLAAVGVTVKLSFIVLGGLASLVVLARAIWIKSPKLGKAFDLRRLLVPLGLVFLIVIPWMARNVIISGYPVYPIPVASFDVDWRVPEDMIANLNNWIKSWARNPAALPRDVLGNWDWLPAWIGEIGRHHKFNFVLPLALFVIGNLVIFLSRKRSFSLASWALFFAPGLGMVTFWFLSAPDPRYAGATFWCLGAGAVSLACGRGA